MKVRAGNSKAMVGRRRVSQLTIKVARAVLGRTALQRSRLVNRAYYRVFRYGYREDILQTRFRNLSFTIPACDVTVVPGIVMGFYERLELDIYERLATLSTSVIDVGGNIGLYSCIGAVNMPHGSVISFEPAPEVRSYLEENVGLNDLSTRVTIEPFALGQADGEAELFVAEKNFGTNSFSSRNAGRRATRHPVRVTTLDSYAESLADFHIDILKIDVEGFDGYVLDGAANVLSRFQPTLFIEYVPQQLANCGYDSDRFLQCIADLGGDTYRIDEKRGRVDQCDPKDLLTRRLSQAANLVVAVRSDHRDAISRYVNSYRIRD